MWKAAADRNVKSCWGYILVIFTAPGNFEMYLYFFLRNNGMTPSEIFVCSDVVFVWICQIVIKFDSGFPDPDL